MAEIVLGSTIIDLYPIDAQGIPQDSYEDYVYDLCSQNFVHIDSTVTFRPQGCTAPILIGMSAMRDADPFDPNKVGKDEVLIMTAPYTYDFAQEGMYVIYCDPSYKTIATCITITAALPLPPANPIPTLGEWGLIIFAILLMVISLIWIKQQQYPVNSK